MPHRKSHDSEDSLTEKVDGHGKELEDMREWIDQKKIDDRVNAKIRTICITSTSAGISACLYIGKLLYDNAMAVTAGVKAFWGAFSGGNHQ